MITFRARLAVREVGLALGLAREHIDALARENDPWPVTGAPHAACACAETPCRLHDLCARIEGLPRHLGQHPGGVVITARPLSEVAPLERARMPLRGCGAGHLPGPAGPAGPMPGRIIVQ